MAHYPHRRTDRAMYDVGTMSNNILQPGPGLNRSSAPRPIMNPVNGQHLSGPRPSMGGVQYNPNRPSERNVQSMMGSPVGGNQNQMKPQQFQGVRSPQPTRPMTFSLTGGSQYQSPQQYSGPLSRPMTFSGVAPQQFGRAANPISGQQIRGSFKKGGHVKETGIYKLHKGEHVVPAKKKEIAKKMCD